MLENLFSRVDFEQMTRALWISCGQIGLPFHGAKKVPANVLASESRLSVDRCSNFVIILFYQDVKEGQSPIAFLFKSETKRWMERT